MANGSIKEGPARADRLREAYAKHERDVQRQFDALPPYRAEEDSQAEITGSWKGIHVKTALPRTARTVLAIALALALVIVAAGWVYVQVLRAR